MLIRAYTCSGNVTKLSNDKIITFIKLSRGWVTTDRAFSGVRGPNFTKLGEDIGR